MDDGQGMLPVGRLLFELHSDVLPKTCANFTQLCTGAKGPCYVDSPIHRVVADGWVQGGDVVAGNGSGGESAFGQVAIPDEGFSVAHDGAGVGAAAAEISTRPWGGAVRGPARGATRRGERTV